MFGKKLFCKVLRNSQEGTSDSVFFLKIVARVCKLTTIKTLSQLAAFLKNNFPDALFSEKLSQSFFF